MSRPFAFGWALVFSLCSLGLFAQGDAEGFYAAGFAGVALTLALWEGKP